MKKMLRLILTMVFILSVSVTALAFDFAENGGNALGLVAPRDGNSTRNYRLEISYKDVKNDLFWREMRDQTKGFDFGISMYGCFGRSYFQLNFEKEDREKGWFRYNISPEDWERLVKEYHKKDANGSLEVEFARNFGYIWRAKPCDFTYESYIWQKEGFYLVKINVSHVRND